MAKCKLKDKVVLLSMVCVATVACRPELGPTASRYSWLLDVASTEDESGPYRSSNSWQRTEASTAQSPEPVDGQYTHMGVDGMPARSEASSYARQGTSEVQAQQTNNYSPTWPGQAAAQESGTEASSYTRQGTPDVQAQQTNNYSPTWPGQQSSNGPLTTGSGDSWLTVKGLVPQKPPVVEPNTTRQIVIPITPSNVTYTNSTNGTTQGAVWITTFPARGGYEGADEPAIGGGQYTKCAGQQQHLRGAAAQITIPRDGLSAMQVVAGGWTCLNALPGLSNITAPVRVNPNGDVECKSPDRETCQVGLCLCQDSTIYDDEEAFPCGEDHKVLYGNTGYDTPGHWCSLVRQYVLSTGGCTVSAARAYIEACKLFPYNCPFQRFDVLLGNPCYGNVSFLHNINAGARLIGLDFWVKNNRFAAVRARISGSKSNVWGNTALAANTSPAKKVEFMAGDFVAKMMTWPSPLTGFLGAILIEMTSTAAGGTPRTHRITAHFDILPDAQKGNVIDIGSGTMLGAVAQYDMQYVYGLNILFMKDIESVQPRITYPTINFTLLDAQLVAYSRSCFENSSPTSAKQAQCSVSETLPQDWSVSRDETWSNTQGWGVGTTVTVTSALQAPVTKFEVSLKQAFNYEQSLQYGLTTTQTYRGSTQISFSSTKTFNVPAQQVAFCKMSYSNKTAAVAFKGTYDFRFKDLTTFNLSVSGKFRSVALSSFNMVVSFASCANSPCCGG